MPVFKRYSESYDKEGYYVHAPVDGVSHPIPLQTPNVTVRIYRELGYDAGDHVPNELTWKLYNAGLHWTGNTGADQQSVEEITDALSEATNDTLTAEQRDTILATIESYTGRFVYEIESLAAELDADSSSSQTATTDTGTSDTQHDYFGKSFEHIEEVHFLDDLHTLEAYGCVYARFWFDEHDEFRVCRIAFDSSETTDYVEALAAYNEFLGYLDRGYAEVEAIERISNDTVRNRVRQSESSSPAQFMSPHIESIVCGGKPDRYEVVPKSKVQT